MKVIYKYKVPVDDEVHEIELPALTEVVKVGFQDKATEVCMWLLLDDKEPKIKRRFTVLGTGHVIPPGRSFVGTAQEAVMPFAFVWHLFEVHDV